MLYKGKFYSPLDIKKEFKKAIRIDLMGEVGAKWLYLDQIEFFKADEATREELQEMLDHEKEHLDYFTDLQTKNAIRPSPFYPLFRLSSKLIVLSYYLGKPYAMAVTEAVEDVIANHYEDQAGFFDSIDSKWAEKLAQLALEEKEHEDHAKEYTKFVPKIFKKLTKLGTKIMIKAAAF
jgi:3-demethoxyubiquinol 3-hydroxylase